MTDQEKNYKEINDMLSAVLAQNGDAFTIAFDSAVTDRITSKLASKHLDVSSNLVKNAREVEDSIPTTESVDNILDAISLVLENNNEVILNFKDGDSAILGINEANSLARLYDLLNINNQEHMVNSIVESKNAYEEIVKLAEEDKNVT